MIKKILKNNVLILLTIGFLVFCFGYTKAYNPYQVNKSYFSIPTELKIPVYSLGENVSGDILDQNVKSLINKINNKEINSVLLMDEYFRKMKTKYVSEDGFVPFEVKIANQYSQGNIFFAGENQEVPITIKWYGSSPEITLTRRLNNDKIQIGNFKKRDDNIWYTNLRCTNAGAWDVLIVANNPSVKYTYTLYCMPYNISLSSEAKPDLYIESIEKISEYPGVIGRDGMYISNHPDLACMDECGNIYDTLKNKETNANKTKCSERNYNTVSFNNKISINRICVKNSGDLPAAKVSLGMSHDYMRYATYNPGLKEWYGSDPGLCVCDEKKEKGIMAEAEQLTEKEMNLWITQGAPSVALDPVGFVNAYNRRKQEVMEYNLNRLGFSGGGGCCEAGFGLPETAFKIHVIEICNKGWCGKTPSQLNARNNYCKTAEKLVQLKEIYDAMSDRIKKSENYSKYRSENDAYFGSVRRDFENILVRVFNSAPTAMDFNYIGNKNVTVNEIDRELVALHHKLQVMAPSIRYEVASAAALGNFSSSDPIKTRIIDWVHTMPYRERLNSNLWHLALDNLITGQHFKSTSSSSEDGYSEWTRVDLTNYESPCDSKQVNSECFWYRKSFDSKKIEIINPGQTKCINVAVYMQPYIGTNGIKWEYGTEMEKKLCRYKAGYIHCLEKDYTTKEAGLHMINISVDPFNTIAEKNEINNSSLNFKNVTVTDINVNEKNTYQDYSNPDLQSHAVKLIQDEPEDYANPPKNMPNAKWFRNRLWAVGGGISAVTNYPYIGKDIRPIDDQCKALIRQMQAGSVINSGGGIWSASGWYGF